MKDNSEVDLKEVFKIIFKQKTFVLIFATIGFFSSALYSLSIKRIWQGEFQILLSKKEQNSSSVLQRLSQLDNLPIKSQNLFGSQKSGLKTELVILKSPSVLINVYNFVKEEKESKGKKINGKRFTDWLNKNLFIEFEENTSVLNLRYRDTDKNLIVPVLEKISNEYQKYSGKDRSKNITQGINYLSNQIKIYDMKTQNSFKDLQEFSNQYDLTAKKEVETNSFIINTEIERIKAANKIRNIDEKIKQLKKYEVENSEEFADMVFSLLSKLDDGELENNLKTISDIDKEIVFLESLYKNENDEEIQLLKERKITLMSFIKDKVYKLLKAEKANSNAIMNSSARPDNVLLEYKELLRNSERDMQTLIQLENEYRALTLEEARVKDPWELITKPTILRDPVGPKRKEWAIGGFILGGLLGSFLVLVRKYLTGKIFTLKDVKDIIENVNSIQINKKDIQNSFIELELFFKKYIEDLNPKEINFVKFEDISDEINDDILKIFSNYKIKANIIKDDNFEYKKENNSIFVILNAQITTNRNLKLFSSKLNLFDKKISGIILIE